MSIERVEEVCLKALRQAVNPLMPVSMLFQKCEEEKVSGVLTEDLLLEFLREHADIVVVDGINDTDPVDCGKFDPAGVMMGFRAILKKRMPTHDEMKDMFQMQLEQMRSNLLQAMETAKENKDTRAIKEIEAAIENTSSLGERLSDL
ncbi:MAG: hypothetical protein KAH38_11720 [Candidatus Hydrogenedentes bacterium]|nr:hypothetical protein [Candidatus Hydrogenedentota bacterium]